MKKMRVLDFDDNQLFVGTKNDCMHFIKSHKLDRTKIKIEGVDLLVTTPEPVIEEEPSWLKRLFK